MSLVGTYVSSEINSTLVVETADVSNGQGSGKITIDGITIPVRIHYHYENNVGPITDLWFAGSIDDPNQFVGGAGRTDNSDFASIKIAGGYPTKTDVNTFEGNYVRQ